MEAEAAREDVRMAGQRHGSPKRQRVDVPPGDVTKPSGSDFTNCFICEDVVKTQSHCSLRRRKLNCCFKMDLFSEALLRVRGRAAVRLLPRVKLRTGRPREGFPVSLLPSELGFVAGRGSQAASVPGSSSLPLPASASLSPGRGAAQHHTWAWARPGGPSGRGWGLMRLCETTEKGAFV